MKEILKLGFTLMIIGLIASLALAFTNQFTTARIEAQAKNELTSSLKELVSNADDFKEKDNYYEAYKNNNLIGKVIQVDASGYSSIIKLIVGLDTSNKIVGIKVLSQAETPGLGANVEKKEWLSQFIGKDITKLTLKKDGGDIDAITGATISSRAVTDGLRNALTGGSSLETATKDNTQSISSADKDKESEDVDDKEDESVDVENESVDVEEESVEEELEQED